MSKSKIKIDKARDQRIAEQILVDTYSDEEAVMAWRCYLEDMVKCPFVAICEKKLFVSPLEKGETVEVLKISPEDRIITDVFAIIKWQGHKLGVPLAQLKPIKAGLKTKQAVEDFKYYLKFV